MTSVETRTSLTKTTAGSILVEASDISEARQYTSSVLSTGRERKLGHPRVVQRMTPVRQKKTPFYEKSTVQWWKKR